MSEQRPEQAPRNVPEFDRAMAVRFRDAVRFLWGDDEAQYVNDYIYGKNARIGCVVFTLRPGGFFRVSTDWKPFYDQHRFYYVVQGELTIHDPESGDVVVARAGEAVHWRGARWHFGYNFGQEEVFVLDWYAPQERPASVTEREFAKTKPELAEVRGGRWDLIGHWPERLVPTRGEDCREGSVVKLTGDDALHVIHGTENPVRESILVSTEQITGGTATLMPGKRSDDLQHPGEKVIFTVRGRTNVYLPESYEWFELFERDALYLPAGAVHQYWNYSDEPATLAFQVVTDYR